MNERLTTWEKVKKVLRVTGRVGMATTVLTGTVACADPQFTYADKSPTPLTTPVPGGNKTPEPENTPLPYSTQIKTTDTLTPSPGDVAKTNLNPNLTSQPIDLSADVFVVGAGGETSTKFGEPKISQKGWTQAQIDKARAQAGEIHAGGQLFIQIGEGKIVYQRATGLRTDGVDYATLPDNEVPFLVTLSTLPSAITLADGHYTFLADQSKLGLAVYINEATGKLYTVKTQFELKPSYLPAGAAVVQYQEGAVGGGIQVLLLDGEGNVQFGPNLEFQKMEVTQETPSPLAPTKFFNSTIPVDVTKAVVTGQATVENTPVPPTEAEKAVLAKIAPNITEFLNNPDKYAIDYETLNDLVSSGRLGDLLRQTLPALPATARIPKGIIAHTIRDNTILDAYDPAANYVNDPDSRYYKIVGYCLMTGVDGGTVMVDITQQTDGSGIVGNDLFIPYLEPEFAARDTLDRDAIIKSRQDNSGKWLLITKFSSTHNPEFSAYDNILKWLYQKNQNIRDSLRDFITKFQRFPKDVEKSFWMGTN